MRNLLDVLSAALLLSGFATAQATGVTSPDVKYAFSEGQSAATRFGAFANGRHQFADGNLRNAAAALKSLSVRHDHRNYNRTDGMGRAWADARLQIAECNQPLSGSFQANAVTTPTVVFSGATSWPIQLGAPAQAPATFGISFPFSTTWSYTGTRDILTDVRFTGGRLANSVPWSGASFAAYALDSFGVGTAATAPAITVGNANGGCVDGNASSPAGATVRFTSRSYGPTHSDPTLQNKLTLETRGSHFGANVTAILALAFRANLTGFPLPGLTCNRIHLDPGRTWFLHPVRTDSIGSIPPYHFGLPNGRTNFDPRLAGVPMIVQGVWTDTKSSEMKLSSASRITLVSLPFATAAAVNMSTIYDPDGSRANASFGGTGVPGLIPALRYGK